MLKVKDLSLYVNKQPIMKQVSFDIQGGNLSGLCGPSGVGKTTLIRAIAGLHKVYAGTIILNDNCLVKAGKELVPCHLRKVGYAPQDPSLYPHMSVKENLIFFLQNEDKQAKNQRAMDMLELLEIGDKAGSYPHELSGGQAQRAAIARALINEPQILLLDETLSGIHTELAIKIGKIIAAAISERKIPGILISHDTELSKQVCTQNACFTKEGIKWI